MTIYGVTLLAACYIIGQLFGEGLGKMLGIEANVGGVGFAMLLLILISNWPQKRGFMASETEKGVNFWSQMYIPVIVAMSATQNVNAAIKGGMVAVLAGIIPTVIAFATIPLIAKLFKNPTQNTEGDV
jgi:malonate transporter MadL subunit